MNISEIEKNKCCGCSGCLATCPVKAISMVADEEGFLYPVVDKEKCVDCGKCLSVCQNKLQEKKSVLSSYAAKNKDVNLLSKSSSGGVSHALCQSIIADGGTVYGVAYDNEHRVVTKAAETMEDCEAFYGSKYVQTNPLNTFSFVKDDLKAGKKVLYFGTSCYIAGLYSYLFSCRVDMSDLYTVDLICHGVPSPKVFSAYMKWLGKNVKTFEFRTKALPWGYGSKNYGCTITTVDGKKKVDSLESRVFLNLFFSNNCLRPHCHECQFAGLEKPADLTIADYWGCADQESEFFSEKGVSAVLVHTEKGKQLLKNADELIIKETTVEKISIKQGNLSRPSPVSPNRDAFWKMFNGQGFEAVAKQYGAYTLKEKIKHTRIYQIIRK